MRKLAVSILFSSLWCLLFFPPASAVVPLAPPVGRVSALLAADHPDSDKTTTAALTVWDFSLVMPGGQLQPLAAYRGKVLLVVNLASQSIYASQLPALAQLQKTYAAQGLVILGVPSGDFGHEELADPAAVAAWYAKQNLGFPVAAPAKLTGVLAIPLVPFLTASKNAPPGGPIHWNYTKFLLDRAGHPVARFEADDDPASPEFAVQIEKLLHPPVPAQPNPDPTKPAQAKPAQPQSGHRHRSAKS